MRSRLALPACLAAALFSVTAFGQNGPQLYAQALSQERAFGDLEQAIKLFDRAAKEAGNDRALAAKAMLGAARSYEKLGLPKAAAQYEELLRTYPEQREEAGTATQHLASLASASENYKFEAGIEGRPPLHWGAGQNQQGEFGFKVDLVSQGCIEGLHCALITGATEPPPNWFGQMSRSVDPQPYLGKAIRYRAAVRVDGPNTTGRLWLRVDRVNGGSSFFDNMDNRPITSGQWNYYTIDGAAGADTKAIYLGVLITGSGRVWVDDASFDAIPGPLKTVGPSPSYPSNTTAHLPINGAPAKSQAIGPPASVVADGLGGIYVSSPSYSQVYQVTVDGTLRAIAGTGDAGFSGDRSPATTAKLSGPRQLALDSAGNLYIVDSNNNRIRKVTLAGVISTVAGSGRPGFEGDGGPATSASLSYPQGVAADRFGNLFISDSRNNRIRKVTPDGVISTIAGTGNPGYSGDGGPAIFAEVNPFGIAVDNAGNLFIADGLNHRVRKITPEGVISTVAGNGTQGFRGDGGPATAAELADPMSVAVDAAGNLFICDANNNRVRKVTVGGVISTVAGNGVPGFNGDAIPATSAGLGMMGVAVDHAGYLYIADSANNRIRVVSPEGVISTFAGNGNRQ